MTNKKTKFKNAYGTIGKKEEYNIHYKAQDMTDQSQLASASIREMAKKFGIDALKEKAEKTYIDSIKLQDQLFGHDFTKMHNSKEELLNVKKKITNLFENIPARLRKELFQDNVQNFLDTYSSNDLNKLSKLKELGFISETQYNAVETANKKLENEKRENIHRENFIRELESKQGELYENYKKTGNINLNINKDNSTNN